jgi:hypothetical protein
MMMINVYESLSSKPCAMLVHGDPTRDAVLQDCFALKELVILHCVSSVTLS